MISLTYEIDNHPYYHKGGIPCEDIDALFVANSMVTHEGINEGWFMI
ncbi:hypothetical protein [Natranaerobius trueperi]|nr:hypothetical protein [Natranaerobius trueperi]